MPFWYFMTGQDFFAAFGVDYSSMQEQLCDHLDAPCPFLETAAALEVRGGLPP